MKMVPSQSLSILSTLMSLRSFNSSTRLSENLLARSTHHSGHTRKLFNWLPYFRNLISDMANEVHS